MSAGAEQLGEPRNRRLSGDLVEVSQEACRKQTNQAYYTSSSDFSTGIIQITFPGSQFAETTEASSSWKLKKR